MTTELRAAIELLQLSGAELLDMVAREVGENPCLEYEASEDAAREASDGTLGRGEGDWGMGGESWEIRDEGWAGGAQGTGHRGTGEEEGEGWEARASEEMGLREFVWRQFAQVVGHDVKLRMAGKFLIDALEDDGYLRVDLAEVAARLRLDEEVVDDARAVIQTLEPAGVGARDLGECLRLQLHARGQLCAAGEVCVKRLDLVAAGDWEGLAKQATGESLQGAGWEAEDFRLAALELKKCNPRPGFGFGTAKVEAVVPDVIVSPEEVGGVKGWKVELNGAAFPKLMAVPLGNFGGRGVAAKEAQKYAAERMGRAKWLVGALEQRAKTTLLVAKAIVSAQRQFLDAGKEFMVPLTLKQVAEVVGVHESTVSRVAAGKYMHTPWGTVAFKAFFASGVASTGGTVGVAASSVQALIAKMVKAEDVKKPLSDEQIVKLLAGEGVQVARRTVAKYRGILRIPGTAERRVR